MKNNKVILLDFDRTLFNTDIFLLQIKNIFKEIGINENEFTASYKKTRPYSIEKQLNLLNLDPDNKKLALEKFYTLVNNAVKFLFPDTISFLNFLIKNNIKSILVTYGDKQFQNDKIKNSNIESLLDEILITPTSQDKKNLYKKIMNKNKNKKIIIIDDLEKNTKKIVKNIPSVEAIKINRNKKDKEVNYFENFYEIKNLDQAKKIISTL